MSLATSSVEWQRYERDGFLIHNSPLLSADLIAHSIAGMEMVKAGQNDTGEAFAESFWDNNPHSLVKIEQPQLASHALRQCLAHPALGRIAGEICPNATWIQVWWVQLLIKPSTLPGGQHQTNVGWHQDKQYWSEWSEESDLFTAWLALSDVDVHSGPMIFARGSHRWGLLNAGQFFGQDQASIRQGIAVPQGQTWDEVPAVLQPGGASFHHRLTYHGSMANHSGRSRRSLAIHLRTNRSEHTPDSWVGRYLSRPEICPIIYRT